VTSEEREVVTYRLSRAREALDEADMLFRAKHLNTYVNRLYYACYYAVSALLLTRGMSTSRYSQVRALLHRELVKPGTVPVEMGQHFDRLSASRQKADYTDFTRFKANEVASWLEQTGALVRHIETLVSG